jgi:phytoene desaturase
LNVIVIGAGLGGLSAALHAAGRGYRVTVLESAEEPGGKAARVMLDEVEVDTGPSVLTIPRAFDDAFRAVGTRLEERVRLRPEGGRFRYRFHDGTQVDVVHDVEQTLANVEAAFGRDAAADLRRFLEYARSIWEASAPNFVFADAPSMTSIMKLGLGQISAVRHLDAWRTMWAAIEDHVRDPRLRNILARYATYNGSNVLTAPATLNCIAHVELGLGGFGVEGGIRALVHALEEAAREAGVTIRCGATVRAIELRRKAVEAVELEGGERLRADAVVANCEASMLPDLLGKTRRGKEEPPSTSGWNAIIRTRRRADRPAHEVVFPERYLEEFRDLHDRGRPPSDPTVYACAPEPAHGRRGWPDHEPLFIMANAPAVEPDGSSGADWSALERAVVARLEAAGITEPGDPILWRRTPEDLAARFPGSRGALYGASSNSMWAAFRRPANRVEGVRGLYLASGSAHPGGGMPLVALSGRLAVENLEADSGRRVSAG